MSTTEECITDNMSCLVTVSGRRRTRQERAWRFAREAGFDYHLTKPVQPSLLEALLTTLAPGARATET